MVDSVVSFLEWNNEYEEKQQLGLVYWATFDCHSRMIFAAAPSQQEFLAALTGIEDIEWGKILAFHMDEYLGLSTFI